MAKWSDFETHPVGTSDRIKELEAELREARMQSLSHLGQAQDAYKAQTVAEDNLKHVIRERDKTFAFMLSRAESAEAKLAKAAEALGVIDALDPEGMIEGCSQLALRGLVLRMGEHARATIAELKGQGDE
jgi:hypothetical protein